MFKWLRKRIFGERKYVIFQFRTGLTKARILEETESYYHVYFPEFYAFGMPVPDGWAEWIVKNHPLIKEVFSE